MPRTTILLVEDESDVLHATQLALEAKGHKVYLAPSGEVGFRYIKSVRPKILVVDFKLPGMTGAKLIQEAKKSDSHTTAVVVTGQTHVWDAVEKECKGLGAFAVLRKPVTIDDLTQAVDEAIAHRNSIESAA